MYEYLSRHRRYKGISIFWKYIATTCHDHGCTVRVTHSVVIVLEVWLQTQSYGWLIVSLPYSILKESTITWLSIMWFSLSCFQNCWDLIKHTFLWPYLAPRNMIIGSLCHYLHIDGFVCASTCPLPLGANTWLEAFVILIGKVVSRNRILCLLIQNL